jgi:Fe-S cluster assembly iron-binding protein IscA
MASRWNSDIVYGPRPVGLRIAVVGGGCFGFGYSMTSGKGPGIMDKTYNPDGFEVLPGKHIRM